MSSKWIGRIGFVGTIVAGVRITMYIFAHPDLTNTRIFLQIWPWHVLLLVGVICVQIALKTKQT